MMGSMGDGMMYKRPIEPQLISTGYCEHGGSLVIVLDGVCSVQYSTVERVERESRFDYEMSVFM